MFKILLVVSYLLKLNGGGCKALICFADLDKLVLIHV
jgi:hypothetical protein